jgi:hypothetical protein
MIFTEDKTGSAAGSGTKIALDASVEAAVPIFMKDETGKPNPDMISTTRRAPMCDGEDKKSLTRPRAPECDGTHGKTYDVSDFCNRPAVPAVFKPTPRDAAGELVPLGWYVSKDHTP